MSSKVSSVVLFLRSSCIFPAAENKRSAEAEEAGAAKYVEPSSKDLEIRWYVISTTVECLDLAPKGFAKESSAIVGSDPLHHNLRRRSQLSLERSWP